LSGFDIETAKKTPVKWGSFLGVGKGYPLRGPQRVLGFVTGAHGAPAMAAPRPPAAMPPVCTGPRFPIIFQLLNNNPRNVACKVACTGAAS
jgi:hypothetical protein